MKSSDHKTVASQFVTFVGLAFALALGFFVVGQGGYFATGEGEKVLGTSTSAVTSVTRTENGVKYSCQRVNCDKVERSGTFSKDSDGDVCKSVSDSAGKNTCYWTQPGLAGINTPQCDVNKTNYRNKNTTYGILNLSLVKSASEDSENIAYYNCKKIVPTSVPPTPTPVKTCTVVGNKCCSLYLGGTKGTRYYCNNNLQCSDQWGGATCQRRDPTPAPTRKPTDPKPTKTPAGLPSTR